MVRGLVREWHDAEGWGVLDSDETPGGCWAHFSHIDAAGYRSAVAGQAVSFTYESPGQDGYPFRAVRVELNSTEHAPGHGTERDPDGGTAYGSRLTITWDDPL